MRNANCVEGYLWYWADSVWHCVPEDGNLVYSGPETEEHESGQAPVIVLPTEAGQLSLRTMGRVPEPRE